MSSPVISKIGEEILAEAQVEVKKRIEEAEKQVAQTVERARREAEEEAKALHARALEEVRLREKMKLSEARRNASITLLNERNQLVSQAFKLALKQLKETEKKDTYLQSLAKLIELSAPQLGEDKVKVKLNRQDLQRKKEVTANLSLQSNMKLTFDEKPIEAFGGCIVSTEDERITVDQTLEARLSSLERTLRKEISKVLFG